MWLGEIIGVGGGQGGGRETEGEIHLNGSKRIYGLSYSECKWEDCSICENKI